MRIRPKHVRWLTRVGFLLPALALYQNSGCLPNNAWTEVLAENIVFTSAVVIQSITSIVFNTIFFLNPV